jgi:hypothetical protein
MQAAPEFYECYGGPMDGMDVPTDVVQAGGIRQDIRWRIWREAHECADTPGTVPSMLVWEWCFKPGTAHFAVTYVLNGRRLLYEKIEAA